MNGEMGSHIEFYPGQRLSYDGVLATVRCRVNNIPGIKGEWLGVEWDDPQRGKHNGTLHGVKYFECRSILPTVASFVRPTRKVDVGRTLLEAIKDKYVSDQSLLHKQDAVIISGKVAEEVGFEKIVKQQSMLTNLKIAVLDFMTISGIAPKGTPPEGIRLAQDDLRKTCPEIIELDLSYNPIENWCDIEDICAALPNLRVLRLNSIRFRELGDSKQDFAGHCFPRLRELHLNECLLTPPEIAQILSARRKPRFSVLQHLWLSQNELSDSSVSSFLASDAFDTVNMLMLGNNFFTSLDPLTSICLMYPNVSHISLQSNKISSFGEAITVSGWTHPTLINLNLSQNEIASFSFVDQLPRAFPNLSALRISKNPVYDQAVLPSSTHKPTDTPYYLTLARISSLKSLNYTEITPREREEGEMYYLSTAEKDIRSKIANANDRDAVVQNLLKQYPRYAPLCEKHDRDNLITQLTAPISDSTSPITKRQYETQPEYPPGSLASRLVQTTFYTSNSHHAQPSLNKPIPNTIPTSSIFALVAREFKLPPLSFKLIYESEELDPVRDDLTTRSQIYADKSKGAKRWDDWGNWDADELVERSVREQEGLGGEEGRGALPDEGRWNEDGVLVKDGRKWKRREVEILFGMRRWGDWLESDVKKCRIRVELVERTGTS